MAELMDFIDSKKPKGMSNEEFAQKLDMSSANLYYYKKLQRGNKSGMRVNSLQGIAKYFREQGDVEALSVLASYALGIDGIFTPSDQ